MEASRVEKLTRGFSGLAMRSFSSHLFPILLPTSTF